MEKIIFNNSSTIYNASIFRYGNRCNIEFEDVVPKEIDTTIFKLVTSQGDIYGEYSGYSYVYKKSDAELILSKIDEQYIEPSSDKENNPTPYTPTEEDITTQLIQYREIKQNNNKHLLEDFLENNPILWEDGKLYGITQADQNEMIADKTAYELKHSLGDTSWKLEWHPIKSACREFSMEEFIGLLNAIVNFVYPYRRLLEEYKERIYNGKTIEELEAIDLIYELDMFK